MSPLAQLRSLARTTWELRSCSRCRSMYDPTNPVEAAQHRACTPS